MLQWFSGTQGWQLYLAAGSAGESGEGCFPLRDGKCR